MRKLRVIQIGMPHEHADGKIATLHMMPDTYEVTGIVDDNALDTPKRYWGSELFKDYRHLTFEKEQYGQFASANAMIKSITLIAANSLGGWFIDLLGYQYIFVWDFLWTAVSTFFLMWIYLRWKQMGGEKGYVAPSIETKDV